MELETASDAAVAPSSLTIPSIGKRIQLSKHRLGRHRQCIAEA